MVIWLVPLRNTTEQLDGTVIFAGKPEPAIYRDVLKRAADSDLGRDALKRRLAANSDGLPTIFKGALTTALMHISCGWHSCKGVWPIKNVADKSVKL